LGRLEFEVAGEKDWREKEGESMHSRVNESMTNTASYRTRQNNAMEK
jgi:hypothetical protein